jgi:hypothetical protein
MSDKSNSGGGVGLCGLTFIVFLILKLTNYGVVATWSWWWVTSPLWLPFCVIIAIGIIYVVIKAIVE